MSDIFEGTKTPVSRVDYLLGDTHRTALSGLVGREAVSLIFRRTLRPNSRTDLHYADEGTIHPSSIERGTRGGFLVHLLLGGDEGGVTTLEFDETNRYKGAGGVRGYFVGAKPATPPEQFGAAEPTTNRLDAVITNAPANQDVPSRTLVGAGSRSNR